VSAPARLIAPMTHILLLTGPPGVGKTTVIRRVATDLSGTGIRGFTTEEIRADRQRVGFRLETFDGQSIVLAHVDNRSSRRVGRYGVDVAGFERVADRVLAQADAQALYVIDEIGKMECLSARFTAALSAVLDSTAPVIATIALRAGGFIERVKRRPDAELWQVTRTNRDGLPSQALAWLNERGVR
jgi:nucleoside-triphosphatase